jgi:peptidoglycan/xylan/chitin deacetylase (PgdA/CDA1 family)
MVALFLIAMDRLEARAGAPAAGDAHPTVALTFDDLPVHGALPPGLSRSDVTRRILAALSQRHAPPTYGFVNAKALDGAPETAEVLRLWQAAGHPLGNHTYSHMDLDANTAEAFERDVEGDEAALRRYAGDADWHWLRFPYLHEGDTLEKRHAVRRYLGDHGYRVAQVTMSFDDYAYNDPYARCLAKGDQAGVNALEDSYRQRAAASIETAQAGARAVYGRDIAHVMLLHIGAFETVMLPRLLDLLSERGFRLVSLPEAEADPAYAVDPDVAMAGGSTLLDQMAKAKGLPPAPGSGDALARLGALCR